MDHRPKKKDDKTAQSGIFSLFNSFSFSFFCYVSTFMLVFIFCRKKWPIFLHFLLTWRWIRRKKMRKINIDIGHQSIKQTNETLYRNICCCRYKIDRFVHIRYWNIHPFIFLNQYIAILIIMVSFSLINVVVVVVGLFIILSVYPTIRHGLIVRYIISMIAFIVQKKNGYRFSPIR